MTDQPIMYDDAPTYRPPYGSPIEDVFAYSATKYLRKEVRLVPQQKIRTYCGSFRVDFLIQFGKRRVAVECDGKAFHRTARDLARDTLILGSCAVDMIFRLQGSSIHYRIGDCLFLLSRYVPHLFTDRGFSNLEALAAPETRAQTNVTVKPFVNVEHSIADDEERGIFHDPDDVPWTLCFRAHSLRPANFYYYMFREFWEIIRYRKLDSLAAVRKLLSDPIKLIDEHFAWLDTLGTVGRKNYEARIALRQRELYPGCDHKAQSTVLLC